ncbi:N/A [soil metagenome]
MEKEDRPLITNPTELKFFGSLGIFLLILLLISFVLGNVVKRGEISSPAKIVKQEPFEKISLTAKSVYVYDIRNDKVLFEKNKDTQLPLASLTKVMTALVATDIAPNSQVVTITPEAIRADGDSGLQVGERWSLKSLLDFSLTSSSNDGAKAVALALGALNTTNPTPDVAEIDFISLMNKKADELHMLHTYFLNETGLDLTTEDGRPSTKAGAFGTAEDMTKLFTYILQNQKGLLEATTRSNVQVTSLDNIVHKAKNTDTIVGDIPGIKGSKTGYTDIAGGNLVIAFDPELGRPIIISFLGSTAENRFTDVSKLVQATLDTIHEESN